MEGQEESNEGSPAPIHLWTPARVEPPEECSGGKKIRLNYSSFWSMNSGESKFD